MLKKLMEYVQPKKPPANASPAVKPAKTSLFFRKKLIAAAAGILTTAVLLAIFIPMVLNAKSASYPIVIVNAPVDKGSILTDSMLTVKTTTDPAIAAAAVAEAEAASGKYAAADLVNGTVLLPSMLSDTELYPEPYSHLENGWVDISVTFDSFAASVSGKIRPKDIVTVYALPKAYADEENTRSELSPDYYSPALIPEELRYVEVVAVTTNASADVIRTDDTAPLENVPETVTLHVTDRQAQILVGLEENGYLHLGLANRDDEERSAALLRQQQEQLQAKLEAQEAQSKEAAQND